MNKPLQNYIEEEMEKFDNKYDWLKNAIEFGGDYDNLSDAEKESKKIYKELLNAFSQSLHRIAEITAKEIVPEKKEKTKFQNDMYDALDDGYNQALSDLQDKIKEFGI